MKESRQVHEDSTVLTLLTLDLEKEVCSVDEF